MIQPSILMMRHKLHDCIVLPANLYIDVEQSYVLLSYLYFLCNYQRRPKIYMPL
jgi:hypothetical protein